MNSELISDYKFIILITAFEPSYNSGHCNSKKLFRFPLESHLNLYFRTPFLFWYFQSVADFGKMCTLLTILRLHMFCLYLVSGRRTKFYMSLLYNVSSENLIFLVGNKAQKLQFGNGLFFLKKELRKLNKRYLLKVYLFGMSYLEG